MTTLTMRIRAVFRPDDPDAITVLRLVGAANDLGMLWRLLQCAKDDDSVYGKTIADGGRHYLGRMGTLHLRDGCRRAVTGISWGRWARVCGGSLEGTPTVNLSNVRSLALRMG